MHIIRGMELEIVSDEKDDRAEVDTVTRTKVKAEKKEEAIGKDL